jgi:hypothetical protein
MNDKNVITIREKENPTRRKEVYVTITAKIIPHDPNVQMSEQVKRGASFKLAKPLVEEVQGPFDENGNLVSKMVAGKTYIFKATKFKKSAFTPIKHIWWSEQLDDGEITDLDYIRDVNPYLDEQGNVCYKYKAKDCGKVRIYAYMSNPIKKVSAEAKVNAKLSLYKVLLLAGADFSNAGEYGSNTTLGRYIETIALSSRYQIPLQKGDIRVLNSPLFGENEQGDNIYNDILSVIKDDFDTTNGTLILYGYSFGGALLLTFLNRLKKDEINVNLLITIDAAKSLIGFTVNRTIPNNVKHNLNIYQRFPSRIGSRGLPNEGTNVKNVNITDEKLPNGEDVLHKNIDEYTLLYCAQVIVYALKGIYSFQNYNEKEIKKQIKEYASQGF